MSLRRPTPRRGGGGRGPSPLLIFMIAVALVFGGFYLLQGAQTFIRTGGLGVQEATQRAMIISTATQDRVTRMATQPRTPVPTFTPIPECQDFRVSVPNAVVRNAPHSGGAIVTGLPQGSLVCVIAREPGSEWYLIDRNPQTRRIDAAYMHETVIEAVNPTLTPSRTPTPLPTITEIPTETPTITPTPPPTDTPDPRPTATEDPALPLGAPAITPTPSPTPNLPTAVPMQDA